MEVDQIVELSVATESQPPPISLIKVLLVVLGIGTTGATGYVVARSMKRKGGR
jgi:NAD(P)H-hydrate repair Nnr-like enzyme with NAD(P)H-hydrate epimerase domain